LTKNKNPKGGFMPKISVTCGWDGLPPINAEEVIARIPSFIHAEATDNPIVILVQEKQLNNLERAVKNYGLEVKTN